MESESVLVKMLRERGVTLMEADYDGYGDSGCVESWRCWKENDQVREEDLKADKELGEAIDEEMYRILGSLPFDWVNNEGGYGTVNVDVATGLATVDNFQRYMETSQSVHEVQL